MSSLVIHIRPLDPKAPAGGGYVSSIQFDDPLTSRLWAGGLLKVGLYTSSVGKTQVPRLMIDADRVYKGCCHVVTGAIAELYAVPLTPAGNPVEIVAEGFGDIISGPASAPAKAGKSPPATAAPAAPVVAPKPTAAAKPTATKPAAAPTKPAATATKPVAKKTSPVVQGVPVIDEFDDTSDAFDGDGEPAALEEDVLVDAEIPIVEDMAEAETLEEGAEEQPFYEDDLDQLDKQQLLQRAKEFNVKVSARMSEETIKAEIRKTYEAVEDDGGQVDDSLE